MPKQKTHKGMAKRFKKTASGKLKRSHAKRSHLFANRTKKQRRQLAQPTLVHKSDQKRISQALDTYK